MSTGALSGATTPRHLTVPNVMTMCAGSCKRPWVRRSMSTRWRAPRAPDCRTMEAELVLPTR
eukprot:5044688-Alexandrium_andersonii.AAC.1